ncbi:hypothetical protein LDENG_00296400 [Lucifuga dentata]|nr:hypothetical protein LDENG_00296400 [Lucifuga dentata]
MLLFCRLLGALWYGEGQPLYRIAIRAPVTPGRERERERERELPLLTDQAATSMRVFPQRRKTGVRFHHTGKPAGKESAEARFCSVFVDLSFCQRTRVVSYGGS